MAEIEEEDKEIKEAYEEYVKHRDEQKKTTPKVLLGNIPQRVIIGIFLLTGFLMYLTFVTETLERNIFTWYIVIVLLLVIALGVQGESDKQHLIPEQQLKAVLYTKLKEKQRTSPTEVPMGDINLLLPCKLKKIEGKPIKYVMSFKIITPSGLEKYFTAEMNPYDGYLMGFEDRPAGFSGTEISDIAFIRKKEDIWEDKYFKSK